MAQVERAAPGFTEHASSTVHVQTPLDLERELGLRRGNVMHVEMGLDSMFAYRPLPELAGYRTPVRGLFLTGASTHPGGGVFGASGRTAARVVAGATGGGGDDHRAYARAQPPPAPRVGRRSPWLLAATTVGLRDRLPAGRRSVAATASRSPLWWLSPRPACCTRSCTAARAGPLGLVVVTAGGGLAAEAVGVRTGLPFGDYSYAGTLGPEVLDVPLVVPLAWTMMAYPVLLAARRLTRPAGSCWSARSA